MLKQIHETVNFINNKTQNFKPFIGIVLGTGLAALVNEIDITYELMYSNIPNFPISTLEFHSGKLIFGTLSGQKVVAMQGRLHYYEGYTMQQITFPIRVLKFLGIEHLMVSNAAGSLNQEIRKGDLMIINDHINLLPENPLRGINAEELGPRFPDMSAPYEKELIQKALAIALKNKIICHQGVYISLAGPNLETKAEYKYLRVIGGDAVGMSTVPEVIVANQMNIPTFAISVITDEGFHEDLHPVKIDDIIATAQKSEPNMTLIMKNLIAELL